MASAPDSTKPDNEAATPDGASSGEPRQNEKPVDAASMMMRVTMAATRRLTSLFVVYSLAYFGFSFGWVVLCVVLQCMHSQQQQSRRERRRAVRHVASNEQAYIRATLPDLPSWVFFPTTERAEWVNKAICQLWPYINGMLEGILRETVEPEIKRNVPQSLRGIHFDEVSFGDQAPRIGGVRVFASSTKRTEIALDLDIVYSGDAKISLTARGVKLGVEDLYIRGTMRVLLGPLTSEIPLVQAASLYFVNRPEIDFNLTNLLNVLDAPGANTIIRNIIDDTIASFVVLPNKICIPLAENLDSLDLKMIEPQGLLRIYLIEAHNMMAKDIGIGKRSTSDPYAVITCGSETHNSKVQHSTVDPVWREHFDIFVDDTENQSVMMKFFDEDRSSRDEPLGEKVLHIQETAAKKFSRVWLSLDKAKQGQIQLEMTWLSLQTPTGDGFAQVEDQPPSGNSAVKDHKRYPRAVLLVFVDSASNLPRGNSSLCNPVVKVSLGNNVRETRRLVNTVNPVFEENFRFCVYEPEYQIVKFEVLDHKKNKSTGSFHHRLTELMTCADMSLGQPFHLSNSTTDSTLTVRMALRELHVPASALSDPLDSDATDFTAFLSAESPVLNRNSVMEGANGLMRRSSRRSNASPVDFKSLQKVCEIQLTLTFDSVLRKFNLVVHKLRFTDGVESPLLKDIRPYVRIYVLTEHSKCQRVTTASLRNASSPVYNQSFEFDIDGKEKISTIKLDVAMKSEAKLLRRAGPFRSAIAGTLIDLGDVDLANDGPQWFQMYGRGNASERTGNNESISPRREKSKQQ